MSFAIVLREDDKDILKKIKNTLGRETVTGSNEKGRARFQIADTNDLLTKIVPFREKHQLYAERRFDFQL